MVLSELAVRLNCAEYKNWVKAGHCLLLLRGCLQDFVGREVLSFHRGLLAAAPSLGPRAACRSGSRCSPRARQVSTWPRTLPVASHRVPECSVPYPFGAGPTATLRACMSSYCPFLPGSSSPPPL